jgi:hypothetical protein
VCAYLACWTYFPIQSVGIHIWGWMQAGMDLLRGGFREEGMCVGEGKSRRRNISGPEFGSKGDVGRLGEGCV